MNYRTRTRSIRIRSSRTFCGQPLYDIAMGPDSEHNEMRGVARGFIAIGDIAVGFLALGGLARGVFALGGVSIGAFAFGGVSLGLLSLGGMAIGAVAIGGMAVGYYALGGNAVGKYVFSAAQRSDEAVAFFNRLLPGTK